MLLWKVWQIHQASSLMHRWFLHIKKDTLEHHKCQASYYAQKAENGNHRKVSPNSVRTKNKTAVIPQCNNGEILDYFKVMQGESFICQLCSFVERVFLMPHGSLHKSVWKKQQILPLQFILCPNTYRISIFFSKHM